MLPLVMGTGGFGHQINRVMRRGYPAEGLALDVDPDGTARISTSGGSNEVVGADSKNSIAKGSQTTLMQTTNGIAFYVIHMEKNTRRKASMESQLAELKIAAKYLGVDGTKIERDQVDRMVPCLLHRPKSQGLLLSQILVMKDFLSKTDGESWLGIFEDDAIIPSNFSEEVENIRQRRPDAKVIYMDSLYPHCTTQWDPHTCADNGPPGCCTSFTMWHRDMLPSLLKLLDYQDPQSYINNYKNAKHSVVDSDACLADWLLANCLGLLKIPTALNGVVVSGSTHGEFNSTISKLLTGVSRQWPSAAAF